MSESLWIGKLKVWEERGVVGDLVLKYLYPFVPLHSAPCDALPIQKQE